MSIEEPGFSIAPNPNCSHIADAGFVIHPSLNPSRDSGSKEPRQNRFLKYKSCSKCGDPEESWVCLVCRFSGCCRYKHGHMVKHSEDENRQNNHPVIAISLSDLSFWCFSCDDYITHPRLEGVFQEFHRGKFGQLPSGQLHGGDSSANVEAGAYLVMLPKET